MKPTHYAIRDLNLVAPDGFPAPAWDILCLRDGKAHCSELIFDEQAQALAQVEYLRRSLSFYSGMWQTETEISEKNLRLARPKWLPAFKSAP